MKPKQKRVNLNWILNREIHRMMGSHLSDSKATKIDLEKIKKLIHDNKAAICNNDNDNALTLVINYYDSYLNKSTGESQDKRKSSIEKLVKLLINYGARPINNNIFNTLTKAVLTSNTEIIEDVIIAGGEPTNESCSGNCQKEIFYYNNSSNYYHCCKHQTFYAFYKKYLCNLYKSESDAIYHNNLYNVMKLLICTRAQLIVPFGIPDKINYINRTRTFIESKLMDCFYVENTSEYGGIYMDPNFGSIEFRHELNLMMNKLIDKSFNKKGIVEEIMEDIKRMPVCCIDIIFEYQKEISSTLTIYTW